VITTTVLGYHLPIFLCVLLRFTCLPPDTTVLPPFVYLPFTCTVLVRSACLPLPAWVRCRFVSCCRSLPLLPLDPAAACRSFCVLPLPLRSFCLPPAFTACRSACTVSADFYLGPAATAC